MKMSPLYSRRSDGKIQIWIKEIDGNKHRSHSGIIDGEIVISEWTVCVGKNLGRTNATTPEQQSLMDCKSEIQKKKDRGYAEDIDDIDTVSYFEPMLAKTWQDYKDEVLFPVFVQPKLDGLRLIANKAGLWTRNGKEYKSIPHIYEALRPLFEYNPAYIFDGEVYADKFASNFNKICSLAKKLKPTKEDLIESARSIEYHIYDFPFWEEGFGERYEQLKKVMKHCNNPNLKVVETFQAKEMADVDSHYEGFISEGYEGLMVRQDGKYENKRTKSLLKYKVFTDDAYLIVDVIEGIGNRSGGAGAIVCRNRNGSTFNSNIKGDREFCKQMLLRKDEYIGNMATIQYFNLTTDGVPRFPYYLGIASEVQ